MKLALLALALAGCGRIGFDPLGSGDGGSGDARVSPVTVTAVSTFWVVGGVSSTTITFNPGPPVGDLVIVSAWTYGIPTTGVGAGTVTDNTGNTYGVAAARAQPSGGCDGGTGAASAGIHFTTVATSVPILDVTIAPTGGSPAEIGAAAIAVHGVTTFDNSATFNTPGTVSPTTINSGTVALPASDGIVVSVVNDCSGFPNVGTWSENRGFIVRVMNGDTMSTQAGMIADRIVTGPASYDDDWTYTWSGAGPNPAVGGIAVFR